jgi:hypothetical protein
MAKNWRLAVCTRWRPLVTILLIIAFFFSAGFIITILVHVIRPDIFEKAKSLTVGMSEQEMIQIMGSRFHTETVNTLQIRSRIPGPPQGFKDVVDAHERVIEYKFEERPFGSTGGLMVGGIYIDEGSRKIVLLQPDIMILCFDDALYEPFLFLAACIVLPWLGLRLWCKRSMKKLYARDREGPLP